MKCSNCQNEVNENDKFCAHCGTKLKELEPIDVFCTNCGHKNNSKMTFCTNCGTLLKADTPKDNDSTICQTQTIKPPSLDKPTNVNNSVKENDSPPITNSTTIDQDVDDLIKDTEEILMTSADDSPTNNKKYGFRISRGVFIVWTIIVFFMLFLGGIFSGMSNSVDSTIVYICFQFLCWTLTGMALIILWVAYVSRLHDYGYSGWWSLFLPFSVISWYLFIKGFIKPFTFNNLFDYIVFLIMYGPFMAPFYIKGNCWNNKYGSIPHQNILDRFFQKIDNFLVDLLGS